MTTSSLSGKPDDYESRKSWTNKDWFTHVGAWENDKGQLCFGSSIAFCAMMQQFFNTHAVRTPAEQAASDLLEALEALTADRLFYYEGDTEAQMNVTVAAYDAARAAIAKARGGKPVSTPAGCSLRGGK